MSEVLSHITQQYHSATAGWYHSLFPFANRLFTALAIIELAWSGIWWAIERHDLNSLWAEFLKKIVTIGFFYTVLLNAHTWLPAIVKSFMLIGGAVSHSSDLYPTDIFDQGLTLFADISAYSLKVGLLHQEMAMLILGPIAGFIVLIAFSLVAATVVVALIESYVVVGAGVVLLGFSANHFTRTLATNYLSYAFSVGIKLFVMNVLLGVGGQLIETWKPLIAQINEFNRHAIFEVMGGSIIFLYLIYLLPNKAEQLVDGFAATDARNIISTVKGLATTILRKSPRDNQTHTNHTTHIDGMHGRAASVQEAAGMAFGRSGYTQTPSLPAATYSHTALPRQNDDNNTHKE